MRKSRHSIRITGGNWRRRLLHFPEADGLRPTADAVRERLYNWLGQDLSGWRCLDLFAGSGALGFEAASRGAVEVVMLERNRTACQALEANRQMLAAEQVRIVCADALEWLKNPVDEMTRFDLITLDPPFALQVQGQTLHLLHERLQPSGWVYVEHDGSLVLPDSWRVWREGRTGLAHYCLLRQDIQ